jgi:thioesterase domain-containing protein
VRISGDLGIELSVANIFQRPTIRAQVDLLQAASSLPASAPGLVELRGGGDKPPVIFFHQAGGYAFPYAELARLLPAGHPVYGVQALGLDGKSDAISDVRMMASNYIEQILSLDIEGTVFLGGHSFGGVLALEVACQLQAMEQVVGSLVLIDALLPTSEDVDTVKGSDDDLEVLVYVIGEIENLFDRADAVDRAALASLAPDRRLAFAAAAIADLGIASAGVVTDYLTGLYNVYRANTSAWARYQVQRPFEGSAIIIRSEEVAQRYPVDPGDVWRPVISGDIQIKDLPGQHLTLLKLPYVVETAGAVTDCLDTSNPDQLSSAP